jgi:hypothetical protein
MFYGKYKIKANSIFKNQGYPSKNAMRDGYWPGVSTGDTAVFKNAIPS